MMMRGTKRAAVFESSSVFSDNKRVTMGSPFEAQQPLDMERAELSKQHVRALNKHFASWVQDQLKNHPDELWEDGAQDYLNHAKNIQEEFSDVVNWLKANAAKVESSAANTSPPKPIQEADGNTKLLSEKPMFHAPSPFTQATTAFGSSWSSGSLFSHNAPFSFGGNQVTALGNTNPVSSNLDTSNDVDGEDEDEQPSSPSLKRAEEKGIITVHEVPCKLYLKSTNPSDKDAWKDKGKGQLTIKCSEGASKGTKESKPTILIRNDVGKILLNALIYSGIKTSFQKNSVVAIFHTKADGENDDSVVARTFLLRTKNEEERDKLAAAIQEYAPKG